ncbi:hypothetical protein MBLNU459_g4219t3 [Dothideomycetes sp. NU459]
MLNSTLTIVDELMIHPALNDPNDNWSFCPDPVPAILFAALFGLTTIVHLAQGIHYRKWYTIVIIISGGLQTATFVLRTLSIYNPTQELLYALWFCLILIAPVWTNAFVYMIMGRLVYNFVPDKKIAKIKAHRFGLYFILLDIVAFLVQVYGAASASGTDLTVKQIMLGIHIYMGGVGFQQACIIFFMALAFFFHRELRRQPETDEMRSALRMLYVLYAVLILITVRIIFRLIEYSSGITSSIPNHEAFMYCFDSLPMFVALVLLNIVHPGAVMPGKGYDIPGRKERKRQQQIRKEARFDSDDAGMMLV